MKKVLMIVLALVMLSGCATVGGSFKQGNEGVKGITQEQLETKLVKGVTTQADCLKMFGEPTTKSTNSMYITAMAPVKKGGSIWKYRYSEGKQPGVLSVLGTTFSMKPDKNYVSSKTLSLMFGPDKKLIDWEMSEMTM